jgi:cellobiose-specific phosphotransferase system component IIA
MIRKQDKTQEAELPFMMMHCQDNYPTLMKKALTQLNDLITSYSPTIFKILI